MDDQLERLMNGLVETYEDDGAESESYAAARASLRSYLSEDTRRLDWLEGLGVQTVYLNEHPHQLNPASQSFRAAIDAAMRIPADV